MGRVRPTYIKRAARQLVENYPARFSGDFRQNRLVVDELLPQLNKPLRNRIAGYISTLLKSGRKE
ncbi:MAG: 30S ribosomal protein S17e [Candidatus Hadarchaeota archaeon]